MNSRPRRQSCFAAVITAMGALALTGKADLTFTNLNLTATSFSVQVSGVLPSTPPASGVGNFFIVNPDPAESPGYVITQTIASSSRSFTGTPSLTGFTTGLSSYGDYAFTSFSSALTGGQEFTGTITGTWDVPVFDPSQVSSLNIFWGAANGSTLTTGVLVGSNIPVTVAPVPEVSSALLMGLTGLLALRRRRR